MTYFRLLILIVIAAAAANAQPWLEVVRTARSVPPPDACRPAPAPVSRFSPTDSEAWLFFTIQEAERGNIGLVEWRDPNGRLVPGLGGETKAVEDSGAWCYKERFPIAGTNNASLTGVWGVRILWNGWELANLHFAISAGGFSAADGFPDGLPGLLINQVIDTACPANKLIVMTSSPSGAVAPFLVAQNFKLQENGQPRPITVSSAGSSMSLALIFNASGSLSTVELARQKEAARQLVNMLPGGDQVSLFVTGTTAWQVLDYTTDKIALSAAIDGLRAGGAAAVYQAVRIAANSLAGQTGRRAIVLMAGAENNSTRITIDQAISAAQTVGAPVFTVGFGAADQQALARISSASGGFYSHPAEIADLRKTLQWIGQMLATQYEIAYTSADPSSVGNLELSVNIGGQTAVATRSVARCGAIGGTEALQTTVNQLMTANCPANGVVVSVASSNNAPVAGLTASNFTLKENGESRVVTVSPAGSALSLAIVLDLSGSISASDQATMKQSARSLVGQLGAGDSASVYQAGSSAALLRGFTTDPTLVNAAIDSATGGGSTALFDALVMAAQALSTRAGRRAIVLMTDGKDNASGTSEAGAVAQARLASAPVFPLAFSSADNSALERIAKATGGVHNKPGTPPDSQAQTLGLTLTSQYTLGYTSGDPALDSNLEIAVASSGGTASAMRAVSRCSASAGLMIQSASGRPGAKVEIPVTLSTAGAPPVTLQFDLNYDASKVTFDSARAGPTLVEAAKRLNTNLLSPSSLRFSAGGLNQNPVGNGPVAVLTFTLNGAFVSGSTPLACTEARALDSQDRPLAMTCAAGSISASPRCGCDINGDGSVDTADVQAILSQALGAVAATCDINGDNSVDAGDVRVVANAAMGLGCIP